MVENPLSQAVRERRATGSFLSDPIPDSDLKQILQAGLEAPSGYNMQPWRFVVVRDPEQRKALRAAAFDQLRVEEAPVVIVACGDAGEWKQDLEQMIQMGKDVGSISNSEIENAIRTHFTSYREGGAGDAAGLAPDWSLWLNRHVMIAFTTIMWMAEVLGYDTAPMEGFSESKVRSTLGIPDHVRVCALLAIGKLKGEDKKYGGRFPMKQTVFDNNWGAGIKL